MSRYARRRLPEDAAPPRSPEVPPEHIRRGPDVTVWAPDIPDRTTAWWVARRRWRDELEHYAASRRLPVWRVMNACDTRRPFWSDSVTGVSSKIDR